MHVSHDPRAGMSIHKLPCPRTTEPAISTVDGSGSSLRKASKLFGGVGDVGLSCMADDWPFRPPGQGTQTPLHAPAATAAATAPRLHRITMPESSSSSSSAVKRACDACHRRKVKCIGEGTRTCKNCQSAGLTCTYNAIPQKKGPKGSRAKIISELRETQRQSQIRHEDTSPSLSPAYIRKPGLLSMELITTCVEYFFTNLYPTQPILHRQKVGETIGMMEVDLEAYCLVVSLCAYMLIQPNIQSSEIVSPGAHPGHDRPQPALLLGPTLLQEATRVRKSINYHESPTVWSVMTSFFLFGSFFCLDKQNTAWFHLREATTLAHILRLHEESHYSTPDIIENTRRRRLYWLLFVTERAYALQQRRPLSLHATINLPTVDEDPSETVELNGFIHLVNLFKPFDDTFVGLWNKSRNGATPEFFSQLQKQLSDALPIYLRSVESQAVDLRCSQQWLKTMVWQLSISHGFLSSTASDNAMSFKFPIEVSRDLVSSASAFSQHSMEVHGIGLIEKLFDVACTLTDVISCVPYEEQMMGYGPRDYLQQLITLISNLRGGQQKYMPLLLSKINETMPNAPGYNLPLPQPSTSSGTPDMYEGVESGRDTRSGPNSEESTPFGSPPLSVTSGQPNPFPQLARDADLTSPVSAGFPDLGQSIRAGGTGLSTSGSVPMFGDTIFQSSADPSVKYESDG